MYHKKQRLPEDFQSCRMDEIGYSCSSCSLGEHLDVLDSKINMIEIFLMFFFSFSLTIFIKTNHKKRLCINLLGAYDMAIFGICQIYGRYFGNLNTKWSVFGILVT